MAARTRTRAASSSAADVQPFALTFQGKSITASRLIELWTSCAERFGGVDTTAGGKRVGPVEGRTERILLCQALRRGTLRVRLNPSFLSEHPEIDEQMVVSILPEREGYERDLITKAGSVEPRISREPLDVTDTATDQAEEYEAYMRDVAADDDDGVPYQAFVEKLAEDGEHGLTVLPADLDAEGLPDFYDKLTERAYRLLDADARREYRPDPHDRRRRYVRTDAEGNPRHNPAYDRDRRGRTKQRAESEDGRGSFTRDPDRSRAAHEEAVRRYLLGQRASTFRVIPALDCFPLLGRGHGKAKWSVDGLIERALYTREELVARKYGWAMLGNRLLLPRGANPLYGQSRNSFYLYTAYLLCIDDDGIERPVIAYTIGGAATWWDTSGADLTDETAVKARGKGDEVAVIDLYAERKLTGRLWHYDFGNHTSDDDPNWYGRPAIWPFLRRILNVEKLETAAHVAVDLQAYTGHYYKPDAALLAADPESVVDGSTGLLRRPKKPPPGGLEPWTGDVLPFNQARIGDDAWRLQANYQAGLQQAMAIDTTQNNESGHALLVQSTIGQTAKRHIREAALRMFKFALETDARIRLAAYKCHEVKWPILTTRERPVGHEVRSRYQAVEFDPEWLGEDENPRLNVSYGEEFNLARADLEMSAAERGFGTLKRVAAALGEEDVMNLRVEIEKDRRWKSPENQMLLDQMIDSQRGIAKQKKAALLQAQARMTQQGVPGMPNGLPTAMLQRMGGQQGGTPGQPSNSGGGGGQGGPSMAASVRGGIEGAQQSGDAMAAQAAGVFGRGAA